MSQKGMIVIIECAYQEGRNGNMDLKASVRHMGKAFLNSFETREKAACFVSQMPSK